MKELDEISKQDFSIWKRLEVTKFVYSRISEVLELNRQMLYSTEFQFNATDIQRGRYIGMVEALDMLLNLEVDSDSEDVSKDA